METPPNPTVSAWLYVFITLPLLAITAMALFLRHSAPAFGKEKKAR